MAELRSGLVEEYVLELCTPEERRLVESRAAEDPTFAAHIEELKASLHKYCFEHRKAPPAELKRSIQTKIQALKTDKDVKVKTGVETQLRSLRRQRWAAVAACALLLVAVGILANRNASLSKAFTALDQEYDKAITDRQLLAQEIDDVGGRFQLVSDMNTAHVRLGGTANSPQAIGMVYWNAERQQAMFRIINLPTPPEGMTYQMWADVDGVMKDMGVLSDGSGGWIHLPFIENAESLNLTLEEGNGSDHPNTDQIVISGTI